MIKLMCVVNGTKTELEVAGEGSKAEMLLLLGLLDDLRFKLLSTTQDDDSLIFMAKKGGSSNGSAK